MGKMLIRILIFTIIFLIVFDIKASQSPTLSMFATNFQFIILASRSNELPFSIFIIVFIFLFVKGLQNFCRERIYPFPTTPHPSKPAVLPPSSQGEGYGRRWFFLQFGGILCIIGIAGGIRQARLIKRKAGRLCCHLFLRR